MRQWPNGLVFGLVIWGWWTVVVQVPPGTCFLLFLFTHLAVFSDVNNTKKRKDNCKKTKKIGYEKLKKTSLYEYLYTGNVRCIAETWNVFFARYKHLCEKLRSPSWSGGPNASVYVGLERFCENENNSCSQTLRYNGLCLPN